MLTVDRAARTISGRAAPFGVIGYARLALPRRWTYGCFTWQEWLPLLIEHDQGLRVGKVAELVQRPDGLWALLQVARGERGGQALELAALPSCGLSIHVEDEVTVIADDGVLEYRSARITEVTLTRNPVFH